MARGSAGKIQRRPEGEVVSMTRNKALFIVLYIVLCAALVALIIAERRAPEAGSELMRRLMGLKT